MVSPRFFTTATEFRKWLEKNHQKEKELLVGFHKVHSKLPCMSWSESVDQALCFGWIDGVRKSVDKDNYTIRFTPRKPDSIWSAINIKKIDALTKQGLMMPAGKKAFSFKTTKRTKVYSHEKKPVPLDSSYEQIFKKNKVAWDFFVAQPPWYKKVMLHWIMSAKQEATRLSRLEKTIHESEQQKRMR